LPSKFIYSWAAAHGPTPETPTASDSSGASEEPATENPTDRSGHVHPAGPSAVEVTVEVTAEVTVEVTGDSRVNAVVPSSDPVTSSTPLASGAPTPTADAGPPEIVSGELGTGGRRGGGGGGGGGHTDGEDPAVTEQDGGEGSASGESPDPDRTLSSDATDTPSEVKITLIPHRTLTPGWGAEPPASPPQESRSQLEYSAQPPDATEDATEKREVVTQISSVSSNGPYDVGYV